MKVFEVLQEDDTQARLQSIGQKIRQAQATGDAAAVMQAGAEMEPILKNEIMPGMYRVLDQFIRGMEEALAKDPNHPDAERVRQELPKLKAELEQSKRDSMRAGMANLGRQDVGEEMPNAADRPRDPRVIRNMPNAGDRPRDPRVIRNMPNAAADDVNPVEDYINALKDPNADPEWLEVLRKMANAYTGQDIDEGRLKSKSYKKSKKAAKASGRRRKKSLRDDVNETATGMGAASIASVSGKVGTMQSRNMYNADGTMKNGVDFDNLLGGKKKTKKKTKTA